MQQIQAILAAIQGFELAHGARPNFILMTADIAKKVLLEAQANSRTYNGLIHPGGPNAPMKMANIEIGQIQGVNRVELGIDAVAFKAAGGRL